MKKHSVLLATAALLISTGIAAAQTQTPRKSERAGAPATTGESRGNTMGSSFGTTGAGEPSSTNPQAGGGPAGYLAPHEVPENGGAADMVQPGSTPYRR
jgi:hypothetical protein